ncbi:MAG: serpin family protein [Bacillota bacterium]|nr:serpin family protein [Bacillota bacterium]
MKKVLLCALSIAVITGFSACNKGEVPENLTADNSSGEVSENISTVPVDGSALKTPVYPKGIAFEDFQGQLDNRTKNQLDSDFFSALEDFSYKSASKLLSGSTRNVTYSPVSLYMALSAAGTGARNASQKEIFSVLGISGKDADFLSDQNSKLFRQLYTDNEIGKLKIANSLWLQKNKEFKQAYVDNAADKFYASIFNVDFSDQNTSKLMSSWIAENTNGVLAPKVSLDKEQILSILNTIYYKDQWMDRFDKDKTKSDTFYLSNGSKVQCDFMNNTFLSHSFKKGEGFTASALYLKNGGSMIFVLPDKGISVKSLLSTPEKTKALFEEENSSFGKVIFEVPKFSYGSDLDLKDMLNSLGMKEAFKDNADFSGITAGKAFISNIKQQTHAAIDEEGVEAAAFTEITYAGAAPAKDLTAEMILNRPFIFAIKYSDKLLFMGVVNNPTEK